jgi:APA family basic amino acid/polyamine antiporter
MKIVHDSDSSPGSASGKKLPVRLARSLSLFDSTMLVVSGVIGSAIFITPADVARQIPNPILAILLWVAGGVVALLGGLALAELGAMFPEAGGQYVYFREVYGPFAAFLYGWVQFTAGNSAGLAAVAIGFALFLGRAFPFASAEVVLYSHRILPGMTWHLTRGSVVAVVCILVLTVVNIMGVKLAAVLQNFASVLTLVAIALMVSLGLAFGHGSWSHFHSASPSSPTPFWPPLSAIGIAFVAIFWTYDGWNLITWVAGEIKNAERNLPRAMTWGVLLVSLTYVSANVVYVYALPMALVAQQSTLAEAAVSALFSDRMGTVVSLSIAVSCFGAMSVVILSGARVYYAMARDGVFIPSMQKLHPRWKTPVVSLIGQGIWMCLLTASGQYEALYTCFTFMMTLTYALTVLAVFILRRTRPDAPRPYRCFGYPWLPGFYVLVTIVFLLNTLIARPRESLAGLLLALLGVPGYFYWRNAAARQRENA